MGVVLRVYIAYGNYGTVSTEIRKYIGENMKRRRNDIGFYLVTILACLAAMIIIVIAALLVYDKIKENSERRQQEVMSDADKMYTLEEVDALVSDAVDTALAEAQIDTQKAADDAEQELLQNIAQALGSGSTIMETLRPLYPDKIVVASGGVYHFVPINRDLHLNELVQENLQVLETGEFQYVVNEQVTSHKGIDVSLYQGNIDWQQVAADGVEYVFIRVGYRGYGKEGRMVIDEKFASNIIGAKAAGLKVGVYFFGQAVSVEEAREEANLVLEQLAPYEIDYPVVYDVEKVSAESGRANALDATTRTDIVIAFLETVKAAGYKPMVYANMEMYSVLLEIERLEEYDKWFAYYGEQMYFPYHYDVWQYTEKGTVAGINGNVDMNISFKQW